MTTETLVNLAAALWLFCCWFGYARFVRHKARHTECLASVLHAYRIKWMLTMLTRENRIGDAALVASLERNASFLASAAMFIIAGLLTIMASVEQVYVTLARLPFTNESLTAIQLQLKMTLLLVIYVYAFFTLTWALRQFGFCAVLLGAAPMHDDDVTPREQKERYAINTAKVIDSAGHSYNAGLRAYYFSLSVLPWFFDTRLFCISVALVVVVLYCREFHSRTLRVLTREANLNEARNWSDF